MKYTPTTPSAGVVMHSPSNRLSPSTTAAPRTAAAPLTLTANDAPPFRDFGTPWWGGDRITNYQTIGGVSYNIQCTVTTEYGSYMMSAGHCGPTGVLWYQGYYDGANIQSNGTMGTVQTVQWGNNRTDSELISGSTYDAHVYTATSSGTSAVAVTGAATVAPGMSVCTDGSFTGYVCGATVGETNACVNISDMGTVYNVCGLDIAQNPNAVIVQQGDSGGAVLANVGTDPTLGSIAKIAGTISAEANNGHQVSFADIGYQRQIFGVSPTLAH
ncbi:hypothetical protein ABCS02_03290 [Microbacterium sp. X-17]|uniref:hypothetical protein n=1 Tax=Microbacterium sp. X-17 TaxID=3144404 RepID=UPI0031F5A894